MVVRSEWRSYWLWSSSTMLDAEIVVLCSLRRIDIWSWKLISNMPMNLFACLFQPVAVTTSQYIDFRCLQLLNCFFFLFGVLNNFLLHNDLKWHREREKNITKFIKMTKMSSLNLKVNIRDLNSAALKTLQINGFRHFKLWTCFFSLLLLLLETWIYSLS